MCALFLDAGENNDGACFVLDSTIADEGGRLRLTLTPRVTTWKPPQTTFELRAPRAFKKAIVDGVHVPLVPKDLAGEDRRVVVHVAELSLYAHSIVLE
jgi:hypothetical protein